MLNINQLHKEIETRNNHRITAYEKILNIVSNKIIAANKKSDTCECIFECPNFIFGVPVFDMSGCMNYIMEQLQAKGFYVQYQHPNILYINWRKKYSNTPQILGGHNSMTTYINTSTLNQGHQQIKSIKGAATTTNNFKNINDYQPEGLLVYNDTLNTNLFKY